MAGKETFDIMKPQHDAGILGNFDTTGVQRHRLLWVSYEDRVRLALAATKISPGKNWDRLFQKEFPPYEVDSIEFHGSGRDTAILFLSGVNQRASYSVPIANFIAKDLEERRGNVKLAAAIDNEVCLGTEEARHVHLAPEIAGHKAYALAQEMKDMDGIRNIFLVANSLGGRTALHVGLILEQLRKVDGVMGLILVDGGNYRQNPLRVVTAAPRVEMLLAEVLGGQLYPTPGSLRRDYEAILRSEQRGDPLSHTRKLTQVYEERRKFYDDPPYLSPEEKKTLQALNAQLERHLNPFMYGKVLEERYRFLAPIILRLKRRGDPSAGTISFLHRAFRIGRSTLLRFEDSIYSSAPYDIREQINFPVAGIYGTNDKYFPAGIAMERIADQVIKDQKQHGGQRRAHPHQMFPNAPYEQWVRVEGRGHDDTNFKPEETAEVVVDIILDMLRGSEEVPDDMRRHNRLTTFVHMENKVKQRLDA